MSFYGSKTEAAALAGVDETEITEAKENQINSYIDTILRFEGFDSNTATEYYDILKDNQNELVLKNFPIISITSLTNEASSDDPKEIDNDSFVTDNESGILQLINTKTVSGNAISYFAKGFNTVKVVYEYGYNSVPNDIEKFATLLMARYLEMENILSDAGVLKSIKIGNYSETYNTSEQTQWDKPLMMMERNLIAKYAVGV